MGNADRLPKLASVFGVAMETLKEDLHTALPCRVESYDAAKQMVSVQPQIKKAFFDETDERQVERLPVITGVPVQFPQGGGYRITFPIAVGDTGLVLFSEASLDVWLSQGGEVDPLDDRRFHLSDGIFLPGVRSFANALTDAHSTKMTLGKEGGLQLFIDGSKIQIGSETGAELEAVALGDAIDTLLTGGGPTTLKTWLLGLAAIAGYVTPYPTITGLKSSSIEVKK